MQTQPPDNRVHTKNRCCPSTLLRKGGGLVAPNDRRSGQNSPRAGTRSGLPRHTPARSMLRLVEAGANQFFVTKRQASTSSHSPRKIAQHTTISPAWGFLGKHQKIGENGPEKKIPQNWGLAKTPKKLIYATVPGDGF